MIVDTVGSDGSNIPTRASGERFAEKRGMLVSIAEESLMPFWAEVLIRQREGSDQTIFWCLFGVYYWRAPERLKRIKSMSETIRKLQSDSRLEGTA